MIIRRNKVKGGPEKSKWLCKVGGLQLFCHSHTKIILSWAMTILKLNLQVCLHILPIFVGKLSLKGRGVSDESVSHSTTSVHCTYKYDVPRVPPTLLPDYISPLPGYGQSGVCGTGVGSVYQGFLQPFSH